MIPFLRAPIIDCSQSYDSCIDCFEFSTNTGYFDQHNHKSMILQIYDFMIYETIQTDKYFLMSGIIGMIL